MAETNRQYLRHISAWSAGRSGFVLGSVRSLVRRAFFNLLRLLALPLLILTAVTMWLCLRWINRDRRRPDSPTHLAALAQVREFSRQYPLHPYCVFCKAAETAWLHANLTSRVDASTRVVEVAIGEGTLSAKVFPANANVVGLDLNPYSLIKAACYPHISHAIVCDGLNPPLLPASFDLLVSNNLLHHVTEKSRVLKNWSRAAKRVVFNDNTPYWASSWFPPVFLRGLGLHRQASRLADHIKRSSIQSLRSAVEIDAIVAEHLIVGARESYFSERTFILCGLCSFLLFSFGPPTPPLIKRILLWFGFATAPLTEALTSELIRFDAVQSRERDTFLSYSGTSRNVSEVFNADRRFACPHDGTALDSAYRCTVCGRDHPVHDRLVFLLPDDMQEIARDYNSAVSLATPAEHL